MDHGDQGPLAVGAVRTLAGRHRNRLRDLHAVGAAGLTYPPPRRPGRRTLARDDFGYCYFSLASLSRFPVHKLKSELSFVCNRLTLPEQGAIGPGHSLVLRPAPSGCGCKSGFCHGMLGKMLHRAIKRAATGHRSTHKDIMRFTSSAAGLAVALLSLDVAAAAAPADPVIKIGHVAATSGPIAHLGKDNENGARMAVEELNAKGGVMVGGKRYRIELDAEDDTGDPRQGTAAAQKLIDAKVVGVVGHETSGTTIPASRLYFDAGIPQISPSASNPQYTHQGYNTAFRNIAND